MTKANEIYRKVKKLIKVLFMFIYEVVLSIVFILCKLLFIPAALLQLTEALVSWIMKKEITDIFIINRRKNRIEQAMGMKMLIKIWKNDYYKNSDKLLKELKEVNLIEAVSNNKKMIGKELNCKTNSVIYYHVLRANIGRKNIRIDKESTTKMIQPVEKILLMNGRVIWKNLINIKFWKYIYRVETIRKYYFKVKESNNKVASNELKDYIELKKSNSIEALLEIIEEDYRKLDKKKRFVQKVKIKDRITEIDKFSLIGIILSLASAIIANLFKGYELIAACILCIFLYAPIACVFIKYIKVYRVCKFYMEVAEKVDKELEVNDIKDIKKFLGI